MKKLWFVLIALAIVVSVFVAPATAVSADTVSTPEISEYTEIPARGQLIIPFGEQFVVPTEWDGLRVTVWRGLNDLTIDPVVAFGNSIGSDRVDRYGGTLEEYVTTIWTNHPIPGFTDRTDCDQAFGSDQSVLTKGESIGDKGCFTVIEYDTTALLPCTTCVTEATETCTPEPTTTLAPAATATKEEVVAPVATETAEPTATPTQSATAAPVQSVPVNWNWFIIPLGLALLIAAIAGLIWVLRNKGKDDDQPKPVDPKPAPVAPAKTEPIVAKPTILKEPIVEQGGQKSTTKVENHTVVAVPVVKQPEPTKKPATKQAEPVVKQPEPTKKPATKQAEPVVKQPVVEEDKASKNSGSKSKARPKK